jgi:hypothetical protein
VISIRSEVISHGTVSQVLIIRSGMVIIVSIRSAERNIKVLGWRFGSTIIFFAGWREQDNQEKIRYADNCFGHIM